MGMFMGCGALDTPMTEDYLKINMKMHTQMAVNFTGYYDIDFLLGMIPHHQAAVDMCNIYYKYWACAESDKLLPAGKHAVCDGSERASVAKMMEELNTNF